MSPMNVMCYRPFQNTTVQTCLSISLFTLHSPSPAALVDKQVRGPRDDLPLRVAHGGHVRVIEPVPLARPRGRALDGHVVVRKGVVVATCGSGEGRLGE